MKLSRRALFSRFLVASVSLLLASAPLLGQESRHGRKYKPPPETSKITVLVTKKSTGKPIMNAAVIFNPYDKDGNDIGNLEVKTDPEGKAIIDIIPTGSRVRVQVIASGYATFAKDYQVDDPTRDIAVEMLRPREQVSSYTDNTGKASSRNWGVQEPIRPKAADKSSSGSSNTSGQSGSSTSTTPPASSTTTPPQQ